MKFCPKCGKRLRLLTGKSRGQAICPSCGTRVADTGIVEEGPVIETARTPLVKSFPFSTMRTYQRDVLEKIESAINAGKKFIILEAPVGFGKSAVAAAVCRSLKSAYVLTSTKQLQEQYSSDFGFNMVMGKSNFTCYVPTSSGHSVACSRGRCQADWSLSDCPHYLSFDQYEDHLKHLCDKESKCELQFRTAGDRKLCTYYKQKWDSFREKVTVGNYAFFFSELRYTEDVRKRKLLVCDEAHDLERQLVGAASFTFKASTIRQYPPGEGKEFSIEYEEGMDNHSEDWLKALGAARESLQGFMDAHDGDLALQDRLIACRGMLESMEGFIDGLKSAPENWVISGIRKATAIDAYGEESTLVDEVVFQPLDVAAYTSQLFGTAETVLLMSATVFSEELLCRTLGIPLEKAQFVKVGVSTFPVENRRIHAMDIAVLNRASMDASMEGIARSVDEIMDRHASERGVIHTTNYSQVNYIMEHVSEQNRKRLVTTQGSMARSELIHSHGAKDASVLISPSLYQGVDLKDDLSRFQVIVKVPYPDLSDRRTQVKMHRERGWYEWQTALRLVQTYGRSVRCFDRETEILTTAGWKSWETLQVGDIAYGVEPKAFEQGRRPLRWGRVPVVSNPVVAINRGGELENTLAIKTNCADIVVTPDHALLVQKRKVSFVHQTTRRDGKSWTYSVPYHHKSTSLGRIDAKDLPARFKIPCGGWVKGRHNGSRLEDDWFWLIGFIIGDGSIHPTKNEVTIGQSWSPLKRKHAEKIGRVLRRLGLKFRYYETTKDGLVFGYRRNGPVGTWVLSGFDSARVRDIFERGSRRRYSSRLSFGKVKHGAVDGWKHPEKTIPRWVLQRASPTQMLRLLEGLMDSDGSSKSSSKRSKSHVNGQYWTSSRELANTVQEMLVLCGFRSAISVKDVVDGKEQLYVGFVNPATTDVTRSRCVKPGPRVPVWCPSTALGTVIARRGGRTFISGNSETDSAVTYVLDSNFGSFVKANKELFPSYFLEALSA